MIPAPTQTKNVAPGFGPAVNSGSIRQSLMAESAFTPHSGTAGGNRAASDLARQMRFGNAASVSRDMDKQNAKTYGERQGQAEQMHQNWGQMQMSRFKQLNSQQSQQSSLAQKLLEEQIGMASDWNVGLVRMGRWTPTTTVIA